MNNSRRDFIKKTGMATGALAAVPLISYGRHSILGSNDRVNFAILGLHGRGKELRNSISRNENTMVKTICDVDDRYFEEFSAEVEKQFGKKPIWEKDFRKVLEDKDIDVVVIATPEHWHAPMAIAALQAGKHVYVEKPCAHNPAESEMLIEAQNKYGGLVQMGNQQRSSDHTIHIIKEIHNGLIGEAYYGKAWYSNTRTGIGKGKVAPVPDYLDWELWQGPAPRTEYRDNVHPYNWHWFWNWGTGETLNNGTHEVDLCRWALQVEFPERITANGGRYHFDDDWQFYDTLVTNYEYKDKMISWEGKSCNGANFFGRGRGAQIVGTEGSVVMDRDGYEVRNNSGKIIDTYKSGQKNVSLGIGGGGPMTDVHFGNLIAGIKDGTKLNSDIHEVYQSVQLLLLSNVAWKTGEALELDPVNGHMKNKKFMKSYWGREYENGWEPKV
ncbi:MAG: Gfo/Idh/MocA family oxidoreductase [Eudoraea sp.]|nr:Gfo/Idh/MocA family oxidoreductase [Eudoraea sp.]